MCLLLIIYLLPISLVVGMSLHKIDTTEVIFNRHTMFCSFVRHSDFCLSSVLKKIVFLSLDGSVPVVLLPTDLLFSPFHKEHHLIL